MEWLHNEPWPLFVHSWLEASACITKPRKINRSNERFHCICWCIWSRFWDLKQHLNQRDQQHWHSELCSMHNLTYIITFSCHFTGSLSSAQIRLPHRKHNTHGIGLGKDDFSRFFFGFDWKIAFWNMKIYRTKGFQLHSCCIGYKIAQEMFSTEIPSRNVWQMGRPFRKCKLSKIGACHERQFILTTQACIISWAHLICFEIAHSEDEQQSSVWLFVFAIVHFNYIIY